LADAIPNHTVQVKIVLQTLQLGSIITENYSTQILSGKVMTHGPPELEMIINDPEDLPTRQIFLLNLHFSTFKPDNSANAT